MDETATRRSTLVKTKERKHHIEVLTLRSLFIVKQISKTPDDRRIVQSHGISEKQNNGKCCFTNQSQKINISPNLNKSSQSETLFYLSNKILSEDSLKTSEDHRFGHFGKLTGKLVFETTSKATRSFEAKKSPKRFSSCFSANTNLQRHLYKTRYSQTRHSAPLMKTIIKDIPTSNSFKNTRRGLNSTQNDEVLRRDLRSNSLQQNGCGIFHKNKFCQIVGTKLSAGENLFCLEGCRKSSQATSLPETTRETSDERRHCQSIRQRLVRKFSSTKYTTPARDTQEFYYYQGKKNFTKTRISPNIQKVTGEKHFFPREWKKIFHC